MHRKVKPKTNDQVIQGTYWNSGEQSGTNGHYNNNMLMRVVYVPLKVC